MTIVSRILGLLRDVICLRFFGPLVWDYFALPFLIPNLFRRLFGEGALSAALIPVYTEQLHRDKHAAQALAGSVVTLVVMVLAVLTLLGEGVIYFCWRLSSQEPKTYLVLTLAAIMLPYMILVCLVAVIGGLLNVHRHFATPAAAPIILNICIIAAVIWFARFIGQDPWQQIYVVAIAVLIAGCLQLLLQYPALHRTGIKLHLLFNFSDPGLRQLIRLMAPMMIGLAAVQINTLMDSLIAWFLRATPESGESFSIAARSIQYPVREGAISFLYCAQRLYQFPLGVIGIALATAVFPLLSKCAVKKDYQGFSDILAQGVRLVIFLALPATAGMILIRVPLIQLLFEGGNSRFTPEHTLVVAGTLLFYSLGLTAYFLQQLVVRAYYSFQDSVTPVKVAVRMIGLNLILNLILIWPLGTGGLALSTALCATLQVGILSKILVRRFDLHITAQLGSTLLKTVGATAVMTLGCSLTLSLLADASALWRVLAALFVSTVIFAGVSRLLKNSELSALLRRK